MIVGLGGDDRIEAGAGDDMVCALAGADRIDGGPGDDRLFGGIDSHWSDRGGESRVGDTVLPGPGDDYVDLGADRRPGTGYLQRDTLVYRTVDHAISADLSPGTGRVEAEGVDTVRVHGQMGVVGTRFDDVIIGSPKGDTLVGGWGADTLEGRGGDDWLRPDYYDEGPVDDDVVRAGTGDDELSSDNGTDVLAAGPGRDFVDTRTNGAAVVLGGLGNDGVSTATRPRGPVSLDGGPGDDYVFLDYSRLDDLPDGTVDMRTGEFTRAGMPDVPGRVAGFEDLGLDANAQWTVTAPTRRRSSAAGTRSGLRRRRRGLRDVREGFVDAGEGNDRVWAYDGRDTCLNAEQVRSCEVRAAPARRTRAATCTGLPPPSSVRWQRPDRGHAGRRCYCRPRRVCTARGLEGDDVVCGGPGDDDLTSYDQGHDVLVGGVGDDFAGSFENPHARVRLGTGDDFASSRSAWTGAGRSTAGPAATTFPQPDPWLHDAGRWRARSTCARAGSCHAPGAARSTAPSPAGRTWTSRTAALGRPRHRAANAALRGPRCAVPRGAVTTRSSARRSPTRSTAAPGRTVTAYGGVTSARGSSTSRREVLRPRQVAFEARS